MSQIAKGPTAGMRSRREMLRITSAEAAKAIGVERQSYYRIERGERVLSLPKAHTLARLFGCSVDALAHEPSIDEQIATLRKWQPDLSTEEQDHIEQLRSEVEPLIRDSVVRQDAPQASPATDTGADEETRRMVAGWASDGAQEPDSEDSGQ